MSANTAVKIDSHTHEMLWFVARGNILKGPYTSEELQAKVRKKDVSFLDYCWRQGFREWRPIGSIEDFDRRGRLRALPEYPTVAVPGGGALATPAQDSTANVASEKAAQKQRKFQVTLARTRRHSITIYEWGFAALFSLFFAFFAAQFALNEVEIAVSRKLSLLKAGVPVALNSPGQGVAPEFWKPLFSAPGLKGFDSQSSLGHLGFAGRLLDMSVEVAGTLTANAQGKTSLGGFAVADLPSWVSDTYLEAGVDPVYIRPRRITGRLPVRAPASLEVIGNGEPNIR